MAFTDRGAAITALEALRQSRVLVHVLSDRRVFQGIPITGIKTVVAGESQRHVYEHLKAIGHVERLDLVLHTSGGNMDAVWPLVRLCRAFCDEFTVIVPMRALSAGTLICIGADRVIMGQAASLSPVDPTTANAFNPKDEKGTPLPISVEDVTSYFDLVRGADGDGRGAIGLTSDEHILEAFKALTAQINPLALGNVKRVHSQIRVIARRLLELHRSGEGAAKKNERVVSMLTEELFSHGHLIDRAEAVEILGEDMTIVPGAEEEEAIWSLYTAYEAFFELNETFNLREWLGDRDEAALEVLGACIESTGLSSLFKGRSKVRKISNIPQGVQVQVPAGQQIPLVPGLPTMINIEATGEGWYANTAGE